MARPDQALGEAGIDVDPALTVFADNTEADALLRSEYRQVLIAVEGVYGRDGDLLSVDLDPGLAEGETVVLTIFYEGDPMAASAFWRLALTTRGSLMGVSEDWP
mgnify:CR=1 FL=1